MQIELILIKNKKEYNNEYIIDSIKEHFLLLVCQSVEMLLWPYLPCK